MQTHTHTHTRTWSPVHGTLTTPRPGGQLSAWKGYDWEAPRDTGKTRGKKYFKKVFCIMEMGRHRTTPWRPLRRTHFHTATNWIKQAQTDHMVRCKIIVLNVVDLHVCASPQAITVQIYCTIFTNSNTSCKFSTLNQLTVAPWNMVFTRLCVFFLSDLIVAVGNLNLTRLSLASYYGSLACRWVWMLAPFVCAAFLTPVDLTERRELRQGRTGSAVITLAACPHLTLMASGRTPPWNMVTCFDGVLRIGQERTSNDKKQVMIE